MDLPPHEWDTEQNRRAIWKAFGLWSICWESANRRQAKRWLDELRRLTEDAKQRRALLERVGNPGLPPIAFADLYLDPQARYLVV